MRYVLIGVVAGGIATFFMRRWRPRLGFAATVLVGMLGVVVGGVVLRAAGLALARGFFASVATAVVGAAVLLFGLGLAFGRRRRLP